MVVKIQKWGNSLAVRIPKSVAQQIRVAEGDNVELKVGGDGLLLRLRRPRYRLGTPNHLMSGCTKKSYRKCS